MYAMYVYVYAHIGHGTCLFGAVDGAAADAERRRRVCADEAAGECAPRLLRRYLKPGAAR